MTFIFILHDKTHRPFSVIGHRRRVPNSEVPVGGTREKKNNRKSRHAPPFPLHVRRYFVGVLVHYPRPVSLPPTIRR